MMHIEDIPVWLATFVTRWHSGRCAPWLARTNDTIGGHSGRMATLALHFWGDGASRDLLAACIKHDLGEYSVADVPYTAKTDPDLRSALDRLEAAALARVGMSYDLSVDDADRLKFLDRLDAYLWARHHAPQIIGWQEWRDDLKKLRDLAEKVGVDLSCCGEAL